jgi:hypothetical protein
MWSWSGKPEMTKVAIIQSNYIPWKGYFDIIHDVDLFVFLDDVQMTKRDWRTRNKIKTPRGTEWLTVPVKGGRQQLIADTEIAPGNWQAEHLKSLRANYGRSPFFRDYGALLGWIYGEAHTNLSEFNRQTTRLICEILGIKTALLCTVGWDIPGTKSERIINICQRLGATVYVSGPSARDYIVEDEFREANVELRFKEYVGYPEYPQLFPPFDHAVTILDLLFNCGPQSSYHIWGWRESAAPVIESVLLNRI